MLVVAKKSSWTREEIDYLIDRYPTHTRTQIAERLGRKVSAVARQIALLGISKVSPLSDEHRQIIRDYSPYEGFSDVMARLYRAGYYGSEVSVKNYRNHNGIETLQRRWTALEDAQVMLTVYMRATEQVRFLESLGNYRGHIAISSRRSRLLKLMREKGWVGYKPSSKGYDWST